MPESPAVKFTIPMLRAMIPRAATTTEIFCPVVPPQISFSFARRSFMTGLPLRFYGSSVRKVGDNENITYV